ncbi:thiosulfate sulfurtransferase/rhodanese-like domain-containing protein 3 isoform X3 [Gordionus sp. m RMFG-2023]|uniref:thiosulfate sulfurtransferase/rhodanese-like domain-containing protein 3 isoform X3 n=1 Tax=Gordionus sp. m RMFG-2023 TaxID=3053472 RepID=UPI0031FDF141
MLRNSLLCLNLARKGNLKCVKTCINQNITNFNAISLKYLSLDTINYAKRQESLHSDNHKPTDVTYEELLKLQKNNAQDLLLIDVREPSEIVETGTIDGSINIPLEKLKLSLNMTNEEFLSNYHKKKPKVADKNIIFYGLIDIKSSTALEIAHKNGFVNKPIE